MGSDLFSSNSGILEPLAERLRPANFDEVLGQEHLVGKASLLRKSVEQDSMGSIVLFGPPGTGKTTIASIIARHTKKNFHKLNAVFSNIQNLREIVQEAKDQLAYYQKRTIVFIDEIHRWNKAQQEALLPWLESGLITLIGATTQNPFFELTKALLSRLQVFELQPLQSRDLAKAIDTALTDAERGYGKSHVAIEDAARLFLAEKASGDVRIVYNAIEWLFSTYALENTTISISMAKEALQKKAILYDRDGDFHYDSVSAFIKSIRGSDPDAALFWASVMLKGGEDPSFIFRRLLISASEDIGLADPQAIQVVSACASAFDRVGMPEGLYFISEAVLYCATCPKSNSAGAIFVAQDLVETEQYEVPMDLRDANRDGKTLGHGEGYVYPHTVYGHWIPRSYMPEKLQSKFIYKPGSNGFEKNRFVEAMLRHTAILAARDMRITQSDADGIAKAYAELSNTLKSFVPETCQILLEHEQGSLFSRIFAITSTDKKNSIAAPVEASSVLEEVYFRDFEPALMPSFLFFGQEDLQSGSANNLASRLQQFFSTEYPLVFYCKNKPSHAMTAMAIRFAKSFPSVHCIVPIPQQTGLIPRIMEGLVDGKLHEVLSSADTAYFNEQAAATTAFFPAEDFMTVTELSAEVERVISPASMREWFDMKSEYGHYISNHADPSQFQTALADVSKPLQVSWRYIWKILRVNPVQD